MLTSVVGILERTMSDEKSKSSKKKKKSLIDDLVNPVTVHDEGGNNKIDDRNESKILKKGPLWQQNEHKKSFKNIFKNRWKQRFFLLTAQYLACFKRQKNKITEMGLFMYKISLGDINDCKLIDDCISINGGNVILWCEDKNLLSDWSNLINDSRQQFIKKLKEQEQIKNSSISNSKSTPQLDVKRLHRISVLSSFERRLSSLSSSSSVSHLTPDPPTFPRLAPQCKGVMPQARTTSLSSSASLSSNQLASHFNTTPHPYHLKPCPFTLSISPSLTQRSLYAQKILSQTSATLAESAAVQPPGSEQPTPRKFFRRPFQRSSLISSLTGGSGGGSATNGNMSGAIHYSTQPRNSLQSSLKSAASEFSFISLTTRTRPHHTPPPPPPHSHQSIVLPISKTFSPLLNGHSPPAPPPRSISSVRIRPSSYIIEPPTSSSGGSSSSLNTANSGGNLFSTMQFNHVNGGIGGGGSGGGRRRTTFATLNSTRDLSQRYSDCRLFDYCNGIGELAENDGEMATTGGEEEVIYAPGVVRRKPRMNRIIENSSKLFQ